MHYALSSRPPWQKTTTSSTISSTTSSTTTLSNLTLSKASRLSTGSWLLLLLLLRHRALSLSEGPVCLSRPPGVTKRPATQLNDPL